MIMAKTRFVETRAMTRVQKKNPEMGKNGEMERNEYDGSISSKKVEDKKCFEIRSRVQKRIGFEKNEGKKGGVCVDVLYYVSCGPLKKQKV